jgi:Domain of unknown function (DUF4124)
MKLFVKLMLTGLVVAFLLPFTLLKDDQGKTMMSFSDFSLSDFSLSNFSSANFKMPDFKMSDFKLPDILGSDKLIPTDAGASREDIFYRWNDAKGNVHFTTEPPPDGTEYTVKGYNPDANVIRAVELPAEEPVAESPASAAETASDDMSSAQDVGNPYNKDNIQKLFDDTRNIEQLLNQRFNNQNSAVNQVRDIES